MTHPAPAGCGEGQSRVVTTTDMQAVTSHGTRPVLAIPVSELRAAVKRPWPASKHDNACWCRVRPAQKQGNGHYWLSPIRPGTGRGRPVLAFWSAFLGTLPPGFAERQPVWPWLTETYP